MPSALTQPGTRSQHPCIARVSPSAQQRGARVRRPYARAQIGEPHGKSVGVLQTATLRSHPRICTRSGDLAARLSPQAFERRRITQHRRKGRHEADGTEVATLLFCAYLRAPVVPPLSAFLREPPCSNRLQSAQGCKPWKAHVRATRGRRCVNCCYCFLFLITSSDGASDDAIGGTL